jgi:hypothetical protein
LTTWRRGRRRWNPSVRRPDCRRGFGISRRSRRLVQYDRPWKSTGIL